MAKTKEEQREYHKAWYQKNKEKRKLQIQKYGKENSEKGAERKKKWNNANPEKAKVHRKHWNWKYQGINLTMEEYSILLEQQNGKCAICGIHEDELTKALCVDHDHNTGKVRGLLCQNCNALLGMAKDSIKTLQTAIAYLDASSR